MARMEYALLGHGDNASAHIKKKQFRPGDVQEDMLKKIGAAGASTTTASASA